MAAYFLNGKVYDTETAEKIIDYKRREEVNSIFGGTISIMRDTTLYKTNRGNWFYVMKFDYNKTEAYAVDEEEVKKLLQNLNAVEIYEKHFGKVERA